VQFSTIEVLVALPMTRWEFKIVPCLAGGNASARCLKMLFMCFADVPLILLLHFAAQNKFPVIIITTVVFYCHEKCFKQSLESKIGPGCQISFL